MLEKCFCFDVACSLIPITFLACSKSARVLQIGKRTPAFSITFAKVAAVSDSSTDSNALAAATFSSRLKGLMSPFSIVTRMVSLDPGSVLREMIRVANRVQTSSPVGKGIPVKLSSSDDLPADCFPTITS